MSIDIVSSKVVLVLNANWRVINTTTVQEAFTKMSRISNRPSARKKPYCALNIDYPLTESGEPDYSAVININPVSWDDWVTLPVREWDRFVRTAKTSIRVPTVIIANNYKSIPKKTLKYSKPGVWNRDGFVCQVTNAPLTYRTGSIDHWVPSSKGGKTSFENCILVSKDINAKKGDSTMEDFCRRYDLPLPRKPSAPALPSLKIVNHHGVKDWDLFL